MASDYGLNFGFRRSDESMATREGRFKTPASGTALLIGTAVEIDPANPGYLKASAAGADAVSGLRGVLVQEESHLGSIFALGADFNGGHDSLDLGVAKKDQLSVMWAGIGTKVWFKNTPVYDRGTRHRDAVQIVDLTGVVVGDSLGWNGTRWAEATGADAWMTVTHVVGTDYCEAVLTF
jgi:hypothetical protein